MATVNVAPEVPVTPEVPEAPAADTVAASEALFQELDVLAKNLTKNSFEFGWKASEIWNIVQEDFMEMSGGKEKKALTAFINFVADREAKDMDARKTVADRIHIGRFISRAAYGKIVSKSLDTDGTTHIEPSYHQLRACIVTKAGALDEDATNVMIGWCVEHQWPPMRDIRDHKLSEVAPKAASDPVEKHFKFFVKLAQAVMVDSPTGGDRYNCAKAVMDTWKKENNIPEVLPEAPAEA